MRGQILQIRNEGYIGASRLLGAKTGYLVFRHMIPNTIGVILVTLTFEVPRVIFTEAFLSFIGMGVAPPTPSWGSMSNEGIKTMLAHPHELMFPALFISVTVLAFNLLGDGLARRARRANAGARMSARADAAARPVLEVADLHVEFDTLRRHREGRARRELRVRPARRSRSSASRAAANPSRVQSIMGLIPMPPGRITRGTALFAGVDILRRKIIDGDDVRGNRIGMIFQDPMSSLNPTMTGRRSDRRDAARAPRLFAKPVRSRAPSSCSRWCTFRSRERRARQYPFSFSGGMLQRAMIAMAIACEPDILIADEPTTALDVTIQAQILDLLQELQRKNGMAIVLITHDLGVVARMADDVAVMYAGEIVETGERRGHVLPIGASLHARPARRDAEPQHVADGRGCGRSKARRRICFRRRSAAATSRAVRMRCGSARRTDPPLFAVDPGHGARCWLHRSGARPRIVPEYPARGGRA